MPKLFSRILRREDMGGHHVGGLKGDTAHSGRVWEQWAQGAGGQAGRARGLLRTREDAQTYRRTPRRGGQRRGHHFFQRKRGLSRNIGGLTEDSRLFWRYSTCISCFFFVVEDSSAVVDLGFQKGGFSLWALPGLP